MCNMYLYLYMHMSVYEYIYTYAYIYMYVCVYVSVYAYLCITKFLNFSGGSNEMNNTNSRNIRINKYYPQ